MSAFRLDRFEVTTGRFRRFVESYEGKPPAANAGAHPNVAGSGWSTTYNSALPATRLELEQRLTCPGVAPIGTVKATWTATPGATEQKPIVCVDWYVAFAFCVWDGGRLPSETEWEYVAAGGMENRLFSWPESSIDTLKAAYNCSADGINGCAEGDLVNVGSYSAGRGLWGHDDLTGNAWEWVLDWEAYWYATAAESGLCENADCVNLVQQTNRRMTRGGGYMHLGEYQRVAHRGGAPPNYLSWTQGFRCARDL